MNDSESSPVLTRLAGLVTAFAMMGVCGLGGYAWGQLKIRNARRGWLLVPVVVAAKDLAAGATIAPTDLTLDEVPEQLFTDQNFKPGDVVSLRGKRLLAAARRGSILRADEVESGTTVSSACITSFESAANEMGLEREREVSDFVKAAKRGAP